MVACACVDSTAPKQKSARAAFIDLFILYVFNDYKNSDLITAIIGLLIIGASIIKYQESLSN